MPPSLETPGRLEPCLLETFDGELADLLVELPREAGRLEGSLAPGTAASLADLVRVMNCYYSNLIEGHDTRPRDIEQALAGNLGAEEGRRNLQLEARAHIKVQAGIDAQHAAGTLPELASTDFLCGLHR